MEIFLPKYLKDMIVWIHLFFTVSALKGVLADVSLTESGGGVKRPGDSLQLTCACLGFNIDSYWIHWIRQAQGKGLEWIAQINKGTTYYASSLRDRVTISKESSTNQVYLQITGLKTEDTAKYYCTRREMAPYWGFVYWGQGTLVTVTSATPKAPSVFPLSPCGQDLSTLSEVSIGCLVQSYFPEPVNVKWNQGAITAGIQTFPSVFHSSSYTLSSQLTIPKSRWESESFQCNVAHEATKSRIYQTIDSCEDHGPLAPEVRLLHSSCNPNVRDGVIELLCIISGFYPKEITVEWLVGSTTGQLTSYTEPPKHDAKGYTFSTTSTANISQADWLDGNTYYCQVIHAASQTKLKSQARKCQDDSSCPSSGISAFVLPPTPKSLYVDRNAKVSCVVSNLESEEGLHIIWSWKKSGTRTPDLLQVTEEQNGTFTAVSHLPIFTHDWVSGETFICSVTYPGLVVPITKKISKVAGKTTAPKVYLFQPHRDEFNPGIQISLTCMITGFYPDDISVQWLENHNALPDNSHINTPAVKDNNSDSYFMYSKLVIPKNKWNNGNLFTCMVTHEALPLKFTQRNVSKSQGKK